MKSIVLNKDVHVGVRDVGRTGVLPGRAKAGQEPAGRVPLEIRCAGALTMMLPSPETKGAAKPRATGQTIVQFLRDVEVIRGGPGQAGDRLDCDRLELRFPPIGEAVLSGISFQAWASGHAVSLQLKDLGLKTRCTELIETKRTFGGPSETLLRGNHAAPPVVIETVNITAEGPRKAKVESITTIRTSQATIFDDGPAGGFPTIHVEGEGSFETRPPVAGVSAERKAAWSGSMTLQTEIRPGRPPRKKVTFHGPVECYGSGRILDVKDTLEILLEP